MPFQEKKEGEKNYVKDVVLYKKTLSLLPEEEQSGQAQGPHGCHQ